MWRTSAVQMPMTLLGEFDPKSQTLQEACSELLLGKGAERYCGCTKVMRSDRHVQNKNNLGLRAQPLPSLRTALNKGTVGLHSGRNPMKALNRLRALLRAIEANQNYR